MNFSLDEFEDLLEQEDNGTERRKQTIQTIYTTLVLNWQWFLLSLLICLGGAMVYLRYATPTYRVSAKMLIKEDDNRNRNSVNQLMNSMPDFGIISTSEGIYNEIEILGSRILARDAVKDLKLYVDYYAPGRVKRKILYRSQSVCVDLDSLTLEKWDNEVLEGVKSITLSITRHADGYEVKGKTLSKGKVTGTFTQKCPALPAGVDTGEGVLTLTENQGKQMEENETLLATILPPMVRATGYVGATKIEQTSKKTTIAELTLTEQNVRRGMDYLRQLAVCYNRQANIDKNEISIKTEEFINNRLQKIDDELGTTESHLESYKKRNAVLDLSLNASQSLAQSSQLETKLMEVSNQIQLIDYLREYTDNPSNQYMIIPSNIGMTDQASTALIASYNTAVQERNRYLKTVSLQAPQVVALTSTLDDLSLSIKSALQQARNSADIQRQSLQQQLSKYQGRIVNSPEQERVLTQIGRQQEVRSGLYLLLLQKREENSISLAATVDKGKLIDEPLYMGRQSPKKNLILLVALFLGLLIPSAVLFILKLFRFRIEGHDNLAQLTKLPIVADVPVASDHIKDKVGVVVRANQNTQIDEIFRTMRSNIQFMMNEGEQVILFTSSISGEGKTFLSCNLAVSLALLGKKVVICGLDIRKPALGRLFGLKDTAKGMTQLLVKNEVNESDLSSVIYPSGVNEHLDLLLSGPIPPNPTELLARENLDEVIGMLKRRYDYIILDTSPIGLVSDTLEIVRHANVNCFVCRADYTPKSYIEYLNTLVSEKKIANCCMVLNGVDMSKKKYGYYYGYGRYGKYGKYSRYGYGKSGYGIYSTYGGYADSNYSDKNDKSIKK